MEFKEYNKNGYIKWEKIYSSYNEIKDREDLPDWYKEFATHIGNSFKDWRGKEVTLIGLSETNEDYYFVTKDSDGKKSYESCTINLEPL